MNEVAVTPEVEEPDKPESQLLMCNDCGMLHPRKETLKGVIPASHKPGKTCHRCGSHEFSQVVI